MEVDPAGILRLKPPTAPLDPKKGARIADLLADVDAGTIPVR